MAAITTVATAGAGATVKGALLTNAEVDANLLNINDELFVDALPVVRPSLLLDFLNQDALDSRVTFARASTATYYDGRTVAKAEQNLLPSAGDLSLWGGGSLTITGAATTAPDGSNTGARITVPANSSGSFGLAYSTLVLSAGTYTFSVYVKADSGVTWVYLRFDQANDRVASFNLSTGTVGTVHAEYTSAAMTSVGNGWFRCSVTRNSASNWSNPFYFYFGPASADATSGWSSSPTNSSFFAWGAQLDQRASPGLFVPATTHMPRLVTAPAGVPRFAFNPSTGELMGLLVEEQRTNLMPYSQHLNNTTVQRNYGTVTPNAGVSPGGANDAFLFTGTGGFTGWDSFPTDYGSSNGVTQTFSIFAKAGTTGIIQIEIGGAFVNFNVSTGIKVSESGGPIGTISPHGNGWYRLAVTFTKSNVFWYWIVKLDNGANTSNSAFLWGAQVEAGAFETSYIPTAASQVTRAADTPSMTGTNFSSWYNQRESTVVVEAASARGEFPQLFELRLDGLNYLKLGKEINPASDSSVVQLNSLFGNAGQLGINSLASSGRFAFAIAENNTAISANGAAASTDTSCLFPAFTSMHIGWSLANGGRQCNTTIRRIAYYPKRLSNTELRALTL